MNSVNSRASTLLGAVLVSAMLVLAIPPASFATVTDPDYTKPLLDPLTQKPASGPWLNVIPNALGSGFTYTPHTAGSATTAGFPAGICGVSEDCYTISVRRFQQNLGLKDEISGASMLTTVHGYGTAVNGPGGIGTSIWNAPSPTFKSTSNKPYRVTWLNQLPNIEPPGHDPTVEGGPNAPNNFPYNRIVTHMHGAHVEPHSDGYPEQWYTPGFTLTGTAWAPSLFGPEGTYRYINTQEAATTWYHDHASGLTHLNTQMGMAGFSIITDNNEKCLQGIGSGCGTKYLPTDPYELGFALQDRNFWPDGSIAMPDQPVRDLLSPSCTPDGLGGVIPTTCPIVPFSKAPDGHLIPYNAALADTAQRGPYAATNTTLEYFGNMPLVNGVVYGKYDVEPRVYRMRFIGGTDSRTWSLHLKNRRTGAEIPFWQIGSEQGLLPNPVQRSYIDLMPGERIDVLVNFQDVPTGTNQLNDIIVLENYGSDMPFGGADIFQPAPFTPSPPVLSTVIPEIMEFKIITLGGTPDVPVPSAATVLRPAITPLVVNAPVRKVSLIETVDNLGRTMPTIDNRGFMTMGIPITENIKLNDVEQWDIINTTVDAHPMHLHLVAFQLIDRVKIATFTDPVNDMMNNVFTPPDYTTPTLTTTGQYPTQVMPDLWEAGWKDTIPCPPGWVTRVRAKFDIPGLYVWHCHILSHEEHDMMRPMAVYTNNILWRNTSTGESKFWYLDGEKQLGTDAILLTVPNLNWKVVGRADFNGDGESDILWRNTAAPGQNVVWYMNGTTKIGDGWLDAVSDLSWNIEGVGDFNADGKPDILWRQASSGMNVVWYMNGITKIGDGWLDPVTDPNWIVAGVADFNADTKPDILWRNTALPGQNVVWYLNGIAKTGNGWLDPVSDLTWNVASVSDFNADGKPDILWRQASSGLNAVWYMNGITKISNGWLPALVGSWDIVGK